jgi:hypothetical protein
MLKVGIGGPREGGGRLGLVDGGETVLRCSNCDRGLACVRVIRPNAKLPDGSPLVWRLRATCAYGCAKPDGSPETSFLAEVRGAFVQGGYGVDNPDDPDDSDMKTAVVDIREDADESGPVVTFVTAEKKNERA